ncbi:MULTISPECIES: hypothetical protein [unclassified Exiguobacterium]|uniref:hypothetical protein n=1 Tax=unclassified Exiguobacterium TaxID=2644629 RepID=UPI001BE925EF|nr:MULTISPECIES: hypothetical protein [unclassified Exiguobacterium]
MATSGIAETDTTVKLFCDFIESFERQGPYKMNVIKIMLKKGHEEWFQPISADSIANEYYDMVRDQCETHALDGISKVFHKPFSRAEVENHLSSLPFAKLTTESPRTGKSPFENSNGKLIVREEYCILTKQAHATIQLAVENKLEDYFEMKQK